MKTKLITRENKKKTVKSYNISSFNCELCKTPFPCNYFSYIFIIYNLFLVRFSVGDKLYDLIEIDRPKDKNYIIFESLNKIKENNNIKSIHVIILNENNKITIGRGQESDVRINDISVSRSHAFITFENGKICLRDLNSKYGSLVLIKEDLNIFKEKISLQIGRTYIDACIKDFQDNQKENENENENK
jgi:hypothetical protein